nr:hypothetical protein [Tanacetum cinerariifolium]
MKLQSLVLRTSYQSHVSASDDVTSNDDDVPVEESKVHSNPLFDDGEINSDELESHVESNFVESLSNHDHLEEPLMPIHIAKEERIRREHAEYISRMEMLFTINLRPHPTMNANTIVESIPLSLIPIQDNDSQREEIDIVTNADEVLPLAFENYDSDGEIDAVDELHVDNFISNSKNELSDNEGSDIDNPLFLRPPPEPPDFELDIGEEILVVMNSIDELECLYPRKEFDVEDDDYFSFMFVIRIFMPYLICSKMFSFLLSAESEDTIFDPGFTPHRLKFLVFGYLSRSARASHPFFEISLGKSDNDSQREEIDIVTSTDDVLPSGFENDDDSEGEIDVVEELHVDNSISNSAN